MGRVDEVPAELAPAAVGEALDRGAEGALDQAVAAAEEADGIPAAEDRSEIHAAMGAMLFAIFWGQHQRGSWRG